MILTAPCQTEAPGGAGAKAGATDGTVMAYVNGRPIAMDRLTEILVEGYGLPVARQLVAMEVARQAAAKEGHSLSEQDIRREHEVTLKQTFPWADTDDQRERMLDRLLAQRNITRGQWMLVMRRNALLRKLAPKDIPVGEAELREEYGRMYGRKVVVRHVETAALATAQKVRELAAERDFAELARQYSINPSRENGGLLPPIGPETTQVSPALRQAALALKTVGEVSETVQAGKTFHVLKLKEIIEPKGTTFEQVRNDVAAVLRERKIRVFQTRLLRRLLAEAKIEYAHPVLQEQADRAAEDSRGNQP